MGINSEKNNLIQWISETEDEGLIHRIKMLFETSPVNTNLSKEEKKAVDEGIRAIEKGEMKSHDEVKQLTKEKFSHLYRSIFLSIK